MKNIILFIVVLSVLVLAPRGFASVSGGSAWVTIIDDPALIDSNGDGLLDAAKELLGLDIHAWDSSGDGIHDYWAIQHSLDPTDPYLADRVLLDDGLTVYDNFFYGTDPWKVDTSGNGYWDIHMIQLGANPLDFSSPTKCRILGDINCDGRLDSQDIELMKLAIQGVDIGYPSDLNRDGKTNAIDYQILVREILRNRFTRFFR